MLIFILAVMKQYRIIVSGKVQGVFFRQSTLEEAQRLGIKGFVRNEANGDVCIEALGSEELLRKLVEWCKKGLPRAVVNNVNILEVEPANFTSFEIRR